MNATLIVIGTLLLITCSTLFVISYAKALKNRTKKQQSYWDNDKPEDKKSLRQKYPVNKLPLIGIAASFLLILASQCFKIVPTGYTGVRTTFGLIDQESCMPGFNGLIPFVQHISLVNNKQQDLRFEDQVWSETSEQTVLYMQNISVSYQIEPESSAWIYANVENWIEKVIDQDIVSSALKAASRSLSATDVTDRSLIEPLAKEALQAAVNAKYGDGRVTIKNLIINQMDFEDSYNQAIAQKSAAMEEQKEQAIRNQTTIEKAQADAEAKRIAAQADADAERIRAQAKAEANKTVSDSITRFTQTQDAIEKWDGQMPRYIGGGTDAAAFGILDAVNGAEQTTE